MPIVEEIVSIMEEKAKARKEVMKDVTFGAMVLTITTTAVTLAAKGVLSVYNAIKHN